MFINFTIGTIGNKTGDLLKSVKPCVSSLQMIYYTCEEP